MSKYIKTSIDNSLSTPRLLVLRCTLLTIFVIFALTSTAQAQGRFVLIDIFNTQNHSDAPVTWNWLNDRYEASFKSDYGGQDCIGQHQVAFKFSSDTSDIPEGSLLELEVESIGELAPCDLTGSIASAHASINTDISSTRLPVPWNPSGTFGMKTVLGGGNVKFQDYLDNRTTYEVATNKINNASPYEAIALKIVRPGNKNDKLILVYEYQANASDSPQTTANTTYLSPMLDDFRLAWCSDWAKDCGQKTADRYCMQLGHSEAVSFSGDTLLDQTKMILTGNICQRTGGCTGFAHIECQ